MVQDGTRWCKTLKAHIELLPGKQATHCKEGSCFWRCNAAYL